MKRILFLVLVALTMHNVQAQNYEKMLFVLKDTTTKKFGCVDINGETVMPFKYQYASLRTYFTQQEYDSGYMNRSRYDDEEEAFLPYSLGWGWLKTEKNKHSAFNNNNKQNYELLDVSSDKYFIVKKNGFVGAVDSMGQQVISCIYDDIILDHEDMRLFNQQDGLASVFKNKKMGCVNKNGKLIIPCIYDDDLFNFRREGYCIVAIKNGKEVYLDKNGKITSGPNNTQTNKSWIRCLTEEDKDLELICVEKNGKHGCIDKTGKLVIPFISDTHIFFNNNGNYAVISQGWNLDENNYEKGKFGYINRKGEIVIPCKYAAASNFIGKFAIVETPQETSNGILEYRVECIDENGNVKRNLGTNINGSDYYEPDFSNEQNLRFRNFSISSNGIICQKNRDGGFSFKALEGYGHDALEEQVFNKLATFGDFRKDIALVEKNGQKWFINEKGENILHDKFDNIGTISLNAIYKIGKRLQLNDRYLLSEKNDLLGLVDIEQEKMLTPCIYEEIGEISKGVNAWQEQIHQNMVKVKRNSKYGYVDVWTGEEIIPCEYTYLTARFKKFQYLYKNQKSNVDENIPICNTPNSNCYAVIIANEKYTREQNVPYAMNDGKTFTEYCKKTLGIPIDNIHYAENATLNDIKYHLAWLKNQTKLNDDNTKVIFYYAGHGIPNESDRTSYILPIDGFSFDTNTGYSLKDLYKELGNLPAKNIIAFIDACFSGAQRNEQANAEARKVAIKAKPDTPTGKLVVFSASQGDESALPYEKAKHGMFTYYLLKKLQETSGNTSLGELTDYVKNEVSKQAFKEKNKTQTPSVYNSSELVDWRNITLK